MSDTSSVPPIVVTSAGPQPTPPATLLARLIALVAAVRPGYTATLPGSLIEDISSTDVGALSLIDQAVVETINSLTPLGSNAFTVSQQGVMLGIAQGEPTNTSVFCVFSGPEPGYVIPIGFTVSDGTHRYIVQDGGAVQSDGNTAQLFCLADQPGSWAVPAGTVTKFFSSVPSGITLSVVNPEPGTPGDADGESEAEYRARVLQGQLAASQGMARYLKTKVGQVVGVQQRLISVRSPAAGQWEVIVGGGDPYAVAYAIWRALFDTSNLVGSTFEVTGITAANPGVVTINLNHGYPIGQAVTISGASPTGYNGNYSVLSVPSLTSFGLGEAFAAQNLTGLSWANTAGGQVTATFASNHGVTVGSRFTITGAAPAAYNGTFAAIAGSSGTTLIWALVSDPGSSTADGTLQAGIAKFDTSGLGSWTSGGVVTPNARNIEVSLVDWPDTYVIPFVNPPQQTVIMTVTWNTTATNTVSASAVAQEAGPALVDYVNSIFVGQPMNLFELQAVFQQAVASLIPTPLLTRMVFSVSIDGVGVSPEDGTGIIAGDPESFLFAQLSGINIVQG